MEQQATQQRSDQADMVRHVGAMGHWTVDAERSSLEFGVTSFWGLTKVRGRFGGIEGHVTIAEEGQITARLDIEAASVDTGNAKRDAHLLTDDFFDAERHPSMQVAIDAVGLTAPDRGVVRGHITILGRSRPIEFPVTIALNAGADVASVTGVVTIDRREFGMSWSPLRLVGSEIAVDARLTYVKSEG